MASTAATGRVVIVGAGPVGLAAAIELGSRGIACVVVDICALFFWLQLAFTTIAMRDLNKIPVPVRRIWRNGL